MHDSRKLRWILLLSAIGSLIATNEALAESKSTASKRTFATLLAQSGSRNVPIVKSGRCQKAHRSPDTGNEPCGTNGQREADHHASHLRRLPGDQRRSPSVGLRFGSRRLCRGSLSSDPGARCHAKRPRLLGPGSFQRNSRQRRCGIHLEFAGTPVSGTGRRGPQHPVRHGLSPGLCVGALALQGSRGGGITSSRGGEPSSRERLNLPRPERASRPSRGASPAEGGRAEAHVRCPTLRRCFT